ncbi:MAG: hypothetical protein BGO98_27265 [Myxococcales bacterium 68-20]|nr:MAG: hypothetical protein BGO98_27265 [Myxococcales bacterium 68-20]
MTGAGPAEALGEDAEELPEHLHRDLVLGAEALEEVDAAGPRSKRFAIRRMQAGCTRAKRGRCRAHDGRPASEDDVVALARALTAVDTARAAVSGIGDKRAGSGVFDGRFAR